MCAVVRHVGARSVVYSIVSATPNDANCTVHNPFVIVNASLPNVTVSKSNPLLYQPCVNGYSLVIAATANGTIYCTIAVSVINVNEPPVVASITNLTVNELSPVNTPVGVPITATDEDPTLVWLCNAPACRMEFMSFVRVMCSRAFGTQTLSYVLEETSSSYWFNIGRCGGQVCALR